MRHAYIVMLPTKADDEWRKHCLLAEDDWVYERLYPQLHKGRRPPSQDVTTDLLRQASAIGHTRAGSAIRSEYQFAQLIIDEVASQAVAHGDAFVGAVANNPEPATMLPDINGIIRSEGGIALAACTLTAYPLWLSLYRALDKEGLIMEPDEDGENVSSDVIAVGGVGFAASGRERKPTKHDPDGYVPPRPVHVSMRGQSIILRPRSWVVRSGEWVYAIDRERARITLGYTDACGRTPLLTHVDLGAPLDDDEIDRLTEVVPALTRAVCSTDRH